MTKILISGLGLIGASIAKAIRKSEDPYLIMGYDLSDSTLQYALDHEIVDEIYHSFEEAAKQADVIFLAAPISGTIELLKQLDHFQFNRDVIVTDVSSVKGTIVDTANQLTNDKITFIGGHPMAGSHKVGIQAARSHLFENAIYVLTPTEKSKEEQIQLLKNILSGTKSSFLVLPHDAHDEMTSVISHFPHLIASSLVQQAKKWEQVHSYLPDLAAGGFRDITRIASSNPKMWQDIFTHNGSKMSRLLQDFINEMVTLKEFLDKNNDDEMIHYLEEAKKYRDGLGSKKVGGALPAFYDFFVDIKDKPGAIAEVVQLLAQNDISIRNIRILEIREDINGALRLSVLNEEDRQKAIQVLQEHDYEIAVYA
ncbi:MAG TPA: prephenate dehydrogenase [Pseudogracilibacillus sp.]|nr:prephenate dehydrogenase [Pseudogracilibacillus sp.]